MLTIPYAGHSGYPDDLILRGAIPQIAARTVLDSSHMASFGRIYRGNAAADGSITWSDVTAAANSGSPGVTIFDAAAPTADQLCLEIEQVDELTGIGLMISQAAVLTGTPAAEVFYRSTVGWVTIPGVVTPSLVATGLVMVTFSLAGSAIVLTDDELNPRNNPQHRCAFLRFTGMTAVSTPLVCSRVYKRLSHAVAHSAQDVTSIFAQGASPSFSTRQAVTQPVQDDMLLFGFDEIPLQILATIHRPSSVPIAQKEWVYSRSGDFAALPAAGINDPSAELTNTGADHGDAEVNYVDGDVVLQYKTGPSTFRAPVGVTNVKTLVVAGGGGGGGGEPTPAGDGGGGGGAGEYILDNSVAVTAGVLVAVTVGGGGAGQIGANYATVPGAGGTNGGNSAFGTLIALGGGGGGGDDQHGKAGGSGGGSGGECSNTARNGGAATAVTGFGFAGGADADDDCTERSGGGGGGAGGVGQNSSDAAVQRGGDGGVGKQSNITGQNRLYAAGGGGGGGSSSRAGGAGGSGIGGTGGFPASHATPASATAGAVNTGSGGGGARAATNTTEGRGADGGSGIVVVRYTPVSLMHRISFAPPSDMAKRSVLGSGSTSHSRYWIGLRQTVDSASPVLPENITLQGMVARGTGASGVPSDQTAYSQIAIARHPAPAQNATMVVANVTTGKVASIVLPAGNVNARASVALSGGGIGDDIVVLHASGPELDDWVIYLW